MSLLFPNIGMGGIYILRMCSIFLLKTKYGACSFDYVATGGRIGR